MIKKYKLTRNWVLFGDQNARIECQKQFCASKNVKQKGPCVCLGHLQPQTSHWKVQPGVRFGNLAGFPGNAVTSTKDEDKPRG